MFSVQQQLRAPIENMKRSAKSNIIYDINKVREIQSLLLLFFAANLKLVFL